MPVTPLDQDLMDDSLLDITRFGSKGNQRKIAVCERLITKRSADGKLFMSYTFRDVKGMRITGRQFSINELQSLLNDSYKMIDKPVIITASMSIFYGSYLDVTKIAPVEASDCEKLLSQFFTRQIENYDEELDTYAGLLKQFANAKYLEVYSRFDTIKKITDGYDCNISHGFRSSPILMVNNFCILLSTFMEPAKARNIVLAYVLVQAIEAQASGDPLVMLKQLNILSDIIKANVDVSLATILEIVEDTVYTMYNIPKNLYCDSSLIVFNTHTAVYSLLKLKSELESQTGVYQYGQQLYRKS